MQKYSLLIDECNKHNTDYIVCSVITLENGTPRYIVSDRNAKPIHRYESLCLQGHYSSEYASSGFTTHGINYIDCVSLDIHDVVKMAKTLKSVHTKIAKLQNLRLNAKYTFSQELLDFAIAINAEYIVSRVKNNGSSYDNNEYRLNSLKHGAYIVTSMIDKLTNTAAA